MIALTQLIHEYNAGLSPGAPRLTQARLARELGTSESLVSRHVSGEIEMKYETARRYAVFFGVSVDRVDARFSHADQVPRVVTNVHRRRGAA